MSQFIIKTPALSRKSSFFFFLFLLLLIFIFGYTIYCGIHFICVGPRSYILYLILKTAETLQQNIYNNCLGTQIIAEQYQFIESCAWFFFFVHKKSTLCEQALRQVQTLPALTHLQYFSVFLRQENDYTGKGCPTLVS